MIIKIESQKGSVGGKMEQEDLRKRAEIIAEIFRDKKDAEDSSLLFTDLIDNEFFDHRLSFEESLQVVSLAIDIIKTQKPRTTKEKMEAVRERSFKYERDVYLPENLSLHSGYIKSTLAEVCKSEGVEVLEFLEYLNNDQKEGG